MVERLAHAVSRWWRRPATSSRITYRNTNRQLASDVVQAMLASFIENKAGR